MSLEEVSAGLARTLALIAQARSAAVVASAAARDGADLMAVGTRGSHSDAVAAALLMHDRTQCELGAAVKTLTAAEELIRGYRRDVLGDGTTAAVEIVGGSAVAAGDHHGAADAAPTAEAEKARRVELIAAGRRRGLRISSDKVLHIGTDPNGRLVWLELGGLNPRTGREAGLEHILNQHGKEFQRRGIDLEDIGFLVYRAAVSGVYTGYVQGKGIAARPIFRVAVGEGDLYIAVQISSNGFIVSANMKSSHNPFAGARKAPLDRMSLPWRGW